MMRGYQDRTRLVKATQEKEMAALFAPKR